MKADTYSCARKKEQNNLSLRLRYYGTESQEGEDLEQAECVSACWNKRNEQTT